MLRAMSSGRSDGSVPVRRIAFVAALLVAIPASAARAEVGVVVEPRASFVNFASPFGDDYEAAAGLGVQGGVSLDYEPVLFMPELSLAGDGFPGVKAGTFRAMAGARVGLTLAVIPSAFVHVGYGFLGGEDVAHHFFSLDTGLSLDYRVSRLFTIGGTLAYEVLANGDGALHGGYAAPRLGFWFD
jgi:hypothetical protein